MTTRQLNTLFNRLKKKHFSNLKTKLKIERTLKQEETSCVAFYFPPLDTIYVYQWHLHRDSNEELKATLIHELVHALFRDKMNALESNPLVHAVEFHDADFVRMCHSIYKKEFSGIELRKCNKNEMFTINNKNYNMNEALRLYAIKGK